jgi:hypothetical protein
MYIISCQGQADRDRFEAKYEEVIGEALERLDELGDIVDG